MCLTYILKKPTLEKTLGKTQKTQKNPGFLGFFKILGFCPTLVMDHLDDFPEENRSLLEFKKSEKNNGPRRNMRGIS